MFIEDGRVRFVQMLERGRVVGLKLVAYDPHGRLCEETLCKGSAVVRHVVVRVRQARVPGEETDSEPGEKPRREILYSTKGVRLDERDLLD